MAKISARGAKEVARWEKTFSYEDPTLGTWKVTYVLTTDGRLLVRRDGGGYNVKRRDMTLEKAEKLMSFHGFSRKL